jgi:hypothetical protein
MAAKQTGKVQKPKALRKAKKLELTKPLTTFKIDIGQP